MSDEKYITLTDAHYKAWDLIDSAIDALSWDFANKCVSHSDRKFFKREELVMFLCERAATVHFELGLCKAGELWEDFDEEIVDDNLNSDCRDHLSAMGW